MRRPGNAERVTQLERDSQIAGSRRAAGSRNAAHAEVKSDSLPPARASRSVTDFWRNLIAVRWWDVQLPTYIAAQMVRIAAKSLLPAPAVNIFNDAGRKLPEREYPQQLKVVQDCDFACGILRSRL
jgi:hypothetical protein